MSTSLTFVVRFFHQTDSRVGPDVVINSMSA